MASLRFIHAADLHLDAVFPGMARDVSPDLARRLHEATFTALTRLVELCEVERPDFLILAGDTYNQEDLSLRAQLAMRDACERLKAAGIPVFLAHGNHDPLSSRLKTLEWPDNVTVFGADVTSVPFHRENGGDGAKPDAIIHGVSHAGVQEKRNLAAMFRRTVDICPQIGILHTTVGAANGEAVYAPCSLGDLAASGLNYWALGHIHAHAEIRREPLAVYPGSLQGLHINEQGPHGCVIVTLPGGSEGEPSFEFRPLAPVGWHVLEVSLEGETAPVEGVEEFSGSDADATEVSDAAPDTVPALERRIRRALAEVPSPPWPGCETMIVRVRLTGRTVLDGELRRLSVREELCDALRAGEGESLWIKDIEPDTRPPFDRQAALTRDDLMGELLRRADAWRAKPETMKRRADEALEDLFTRGRSRKFLPMPPPEEIAELLSEAERLAVDYLEQ